MNALTVLLNSTKKRGLFNTLQFIFYEYIFDSIYKVNTKGFITLDKLTTVGKIDNSVQYQASNYFLLLKYFEKYKEFVKDKTIVDFGSGKGRVLILGMKYQAKKCIGIEFAKELIDICKDNLKNYKRRIRSKATYEVISDDVCDYKFSEEEDILFFYNPFNGIILNQIFEKISKLRKEMTIVYINPVHRDLFEKYFEEIDNLNNEVIIYKTNANKNK